MHALLYNKVDISNLQGWCKYCKLIHAGSVNSAVKPVLRILYCMLHLLFAVARNDQWNSEHYLNRRAEPKRGKPTFIHLGIFWQFPYIEKVTAMRCIPYNGIEKPNVCKWAAHCKKCAKHVAGHEHRKPAKSVTQATKYKWTCHDARHVYRLCAVYDCQVWSTCHTPL